MIVCVDVDYRTDVAVAAALWFRGWQAAEPENQAVALFREIAPYEPGAFFRRELPCLLGVLALGPKPDVVVVDGYVWLGDGKAGLGAYLHEALGCVVVGVAKTRFLSATAAVPVLRGESRSPLFVSAVGIPVDVAAAHVSSMHGAYRIPTLLKQVDDLARSTVHDQFPQSPL